MKISTRRCSPIPIDEGHKQLEQQHLEGKEGGIALTDDPESQIKLPEGRKHQAFSFDVRDVVNTF